MPTRMRYFLERKREYDEVAVGLVTAHPGYLGAQDKVYVVIRWGGGRSTRESSSIRTRESTLPSSTECDWHRITMAQ